MPVTARLSKRFYDVLGEDVANELVDWFNAVDLSYRTDLRAAHRGRSARDLRGDTVPTQHALRLLTPASFLDQIRQMGPYLPDFLCHGTGIRPVAQPEVVLVGADGAGGVAGDGSEAAFLS